MNKKDHIASREEQLNLLHQEILMKQEALLHTSSTLLCLGPHGTMTASLASPVDASVRNAKLLKDINSLDQELRAHLNSVPSPRFVTLQNNYWSMVRSLLPLWKQSLPDGPWTKIAQQLQQQHQQHQSLLSDRSMRSRRQRGTLQARATKWRSQIMKCFN